MIPTALSVLAALSTTRPARLRRRRVDQRSLTMVVAQINNVGATP